MRAWAAGAAERLINALIEESTAAQDALAGLDGRSLGIRVTGPELEFVIRAHSGRLQLIEAPAASASASLTGTPLALLELLRRPSRRDLHGSGVTVTGDARVLERFARLFELAQPDLEEELARLTGDVVAHETFRAAGRASGWVGRALEALLLNTAEYLQEESRALPARAEAEHLFGEIERLRDGVERVLVRAERAGVGPADTDTSPCGDSD